MNLRQLRAEARLLQRKIPGLLLLFFIPIMILLLSNFLGDSQEDLMEYFASIDLKQAFYLEVSRGLFSQVINFIISLFIISASYALIDLLRRQTEQLKLLHLYLLCFASVWFCFVGVFYFGLALSFLYLRATASSISTIKLLIINCLIKLFSRLATIRLLCFWACFSLL